MIGNDIQKAIAFLCEGNLVAIPTETVYGLAGNALNSDAIVRIYETKNRPAFNPLIIHIADSDQLVDYASSIPDDALKLAKTFWPGPLTLLLPKRNRIPEIATAGSELAAFRVPNHPISLALLKQLPFPLAAPSANPSGYISPTQSAHVEKQLGSKIPYILEGGLCNLGVESTIIGFPNGIPTVYRFGALAIEDIQKIIGPIQVYQGSKTEASGMLTSHYAPKTSFYLNQSVDFMRNYPQNEIAEIRFQEQSSGLWTQKILSSTGNLSEAARHLFSIMHELDCLNLKAIFAQTVPNQGIGMAINDRLKRASAGN